jgi:uncharacterized Zn finger protein
MYGGWRWRPYESVASRKQKAESVTAKKLKKGEKIKPIKIEGKKIANSFWGKAWCSHLESFSDYKTRLQRGRSYIRNSAVIHLDITKSKINSLVQGSSLYNVEIKIKPLTTQKWQEIASKCSNEIGSVIELLQGKLSNAVMANITNKETGLFPHPQEISLRCSCPDFAYMCKHIAATLYGVGARLDNEPELLFTLRDVDHAELIKNATVTTATKSAKSKVITGQDLSALFGIDIDDASKKDDSQSKLLPKSVSKIAKSQIIQPAEKIKKKAKSKSKTNSKGPVRKSTKNKTRSGSKKSNG